MLPHMKKSNQEKPEEFISVENEMAKIHAETHPFTPARDVPNVELDKDTKDGKKATD